MLPVNEKTNISLGNSDKGMIYHTHTKPEYTERKYQHLYILSDDEINEGDWCLDTLHNHVFQFGVFRGSSNSNKKIISTTNEFLEIVSEGINPVYQKLPQPSQSFIEKYVEEYNKGNIITEVMVEYKGACYNCGEYHENSVLCMDMYSGEYDPEQEPFIPKINEGNTITISNVKDTYTREEVRDLLDKLWDNIMDNSYNKTNSKEYDKWVDENL